MKSVVSSLWSLVGFGQRRRLETAELSLRAALAERDEYLRQLNDALAACEELRRHATTFAANLSFAQLASDLNRRHPKDGVIKELA
jgi:hypothetical protein